MESPTPKLRTKFSNNDELQDIAIPPSQCITLLDNTDTTKPSENKDSETIIRTLKSPNLKWKRRSIKQSNDESDDDTEKGNNVL